MILGLALVVALSIVSLVVVGLLLRAGTRRSFPEQYATPLLPDVDPDYVPPTLPSLDTRGLT